MSICKGKFFCLDYREILYFLIKIIKRLIEIRSAMYICIGVRLYLSDEFRDILRKYESLSVDGIFF